MAELAGDYLLIPVRYVRSGKIGLND